MSRDDTPLRWPPQADSLPYHQKAATINLIANALQWISPILNSNCGKNEPPAQFRIAGMPAYADGTNWNPGAGEGIYYYNSGGVWTKL